VERKEDMIPVGTSVARDIVVTFLALQEESCEYGNENDTFFGFCHIEYCYLISTKLRDWVECQGKKTSCVGKKGEGTVTCGRCAMEQVTSHVSVLMRESYRIFNRQYI